MLVKRWWHTRRLAKSWYGHKWIVTTWRGWFLFGIVPLIVWPVSAERRGS